MPSSLLYQLTNHRAPPPFITIDRRAYESKEKIGGFLKKGKDLIFDVKYYFFLCYIVHFFITFLHCSSKLPKYSINYPSLSFLGLSMLKYILYEECCIMKGTIFSTSATAHQSAAN